MKTNDIFLYWTVTVFVLAITAGMYLKHIDYWFIGAVIVFLLVGYYFDIAEQEQNHKTRVLDKSDYKMQYQAPDEPDWEAEAAISAIEDSWDDTVTKQWAVSDYDKDMRAFMLNKALSPYKEDEDWEKMWDSKVNCNKCKNEVYLHVCMCKPVVNN